MQVTENRIEPPLQLAGAGRGKRSRYRHPLAAVHRQYRLVLPVFFCFLTAKKRQAANGGNTSEQLDLYLKKSHT
jgi:hypothetical protein